MKKIFTAAVILLFVYGCNDSKTNTDETVVTTDSSTTTTTPAVTEAPAAIVDSATMMKNWMAYMTPGDVHKMMASWDGTWDCKVTMWHADGALPELSKGTASNKMVMGGRYHVGSFTGNMMGQPFEGISTLAYDNNKKVFISTWIDNMGTGMMKLEGPWDEASKSITLSGTCVDPSSGTGKEMAVRETMRIIDDKTQIMEMFGPGNDGKEFKMMEIKYTRK